MRIRLCQDAAELARTAAGLMIDEIRRKPDLLLCAATGGSPEGAYAELTSRRDQFPQDRLRILKLDEWGGLAPDDPRTCGYYLQTRLLDPLNISPDRFFGFDSQPADPAAEAARVQALIEREGPIDVCVLGIGLNGHIAMNEPADSLQAGCHVAALSESTLAHPMLHGAGPLPAYGLTTGMANLFQSRHVLLLISGAHKREITRRLLERRISTGLPASLLWMHPAVTCLIDQEAAG
ncbi:MAG: 6-phosphogluconolactonase [Bacteroidia bacterium]|nr:6-phosphogluconolactonase [Bacteroidia bacterium]